MTEPDLTRTHEVIEILDIIRDNVEPGCKDRCYIKGSGADSVKWALKEACEYLWAYARQGLLIKYAQEDDNSIRDVLDMLKTKMNRIYGKSCYIDTDSAKEVTDEANIS